MRVHINQEALDLGIHPISFQALLRIQRPHGKPSPLKNKPLASRIDAALGPEPDGTRKNPEPKERIFSVR